MADGPAPSAPGVRLVLTTAPPGKARELAGRLVEGRLAACVNLVPGLRSLYRWQGTVHDDPETLLLVKTTEDRLADLEGALRALHPYELPEFLILAPDGGAAWLDWVVASTRADG
jgi:periplasmic divalent cation tolerance protein